MNNKTAIVGAVGLGAALMYFFDPDRGKRRRALVRDKVESAGNKASEYAEKMGRDVRNRAYGRGRGNQINSQRGRSHRRCPGRSRARETREILRADGRDQCPGQRRDRDFEWTNLSDRAAGSSARDEIRARR